SAMQRLSPTDAWAIAEPLLSHADDANDANLPLMCWYSIEPHVLRNPSNAVLELVPKVRIPLVRRFIVRRAIEYALVQKAEGGLLVWVLALKHSGDEDVQLDLLQGARDALRGRKRLAIDDYWTGVYVKLSQSKRAEIRQCALALGLIFDDP